MSGESLCTTLSGRKEPAVFRSFTFQYTSLILIILSFTCGTLTAPAPAPASKSARKLAPIRAESALVQTALQPEAMEITPAFDARGKLVPDAALQALARVLTQHDVNAEIEFLSPEEDLPAASLKALEVHHYLVSLDVPPAALLVAVRSVSNAAGPKRVRIRLFRESPA